VLPDDAPFVTGSIGLLGTKPSWELMQNCDTLLTAAPRAPAPINIATFLPALSTSAARRKSSS
jgi:thiamine pyrophosphate-dependent acetolactate synthase large subunit-like protein